MYTSTCVSGGPAFDAVIPGFAPWTTDQNVFRSVCHVNRGFMNPAALYKIFKILQDFQKYIMK